MALPAQPELHTVRYLRQHGLEKLIQTFALTAQRHAKYPNLVQLKYDQLSSEMSTKIVQECRGLLLDEDDDWRVLSFPYEKFFNYNEKNAAKLDWSTAKAYDKVDGSLMVLYWYKGEWHVGSSGRPDASGKLYRSRGTPLEHYTMEKLFWEIWHQLNYKLPEEEDKHMCFMFEMVSPRNRILVMPKEEMIFVHGGRNMETFEEVAPEMYSEKYRWRTPRLFRAAGTTSLQELIEESKKISINTGEGFVAVDASFRRVKVKSPQYVLMSLMNWRDKDGLNKRRMLEVVRANEGEEFLSYFPQWSNLYSHLKMRYEELCDNVQKIFQEAQKIAVSDKEFSEFVANHPNLASVLWGLRKGTISSVKRMDIKKLESLLPEEEINTYGPTPDFGMTMEELLEMEKGNLEPPFKASQGPTPKKRRDKKKQKEAELEGV